MILKDYIRDIEGFPKPGITFRDITPLLADPEAVRYCVETFREALHGVRIDKVVGVESRGFFFATLLAQELHAGFVPVRKPGKLPFRTLKATYELEYGSDTLEMHTDAIRPGEKVLIHDDVLATGGTAAAVCELVEKLGGEIVQCCFLAELRFLNGRHKLPGREIYSLVQY
ncbi:MAG: adenine phosphoribosyltransferase [Bacteroidia bacterium]|nr:adenine phosphoribosyltransferase [Bacteroidia bacterium]